MCQGICKTCDRTIPETKEFVTCNGCGRPICETCVENGAEYISPVSGESYCEQCLINVEAPRGLNSGSAEFSAYYFNQEQELEAASFTF